MTDLDEDRALLSGIPATQLPRSQRVIDFYAMQRAKEGLPDLAYLVGGTKPRNLWLWQVGILRPLGNLYGKIYVSYEFLTCLAAGPDAPSPYPLIHPDELVWSGHLMNFDLTLEKAIDRLRVMQSTALDFHMQNAATTRQGIVRLQARLRDQEREIEAAKNFSLDDFLKGPSRAP